MTSPAAIWSMTCCGNKQMERLDDAGLVDVSSVGAQDDSDASDAVWGFGGGAPMLLIFSSSLWWLFSWVRFRFAAAKAAAKADGGACSDIVVVE